MRLGSFVLLGELLEELQPRRIKVEIEEPPAVFRIGIDVTDRGRQAVEKLLPRQSAQGHAREQLWIALARVGVGTGELVSSTRGDRSDHEFKIELVSGEFMLNH